MWRPWTRSAPLPTSTMYCTINWLRVGSSYLTCPPSLNAQGPRDGGRVARYWLLRTYWPRYHTNTRHSHDGTCSHNACHRCLMQECLSISTSWTASMSPTPRWAYALRLTLVPLAVCWLTLCGTVVVRCRKRSAVPLEATPPAGRRSSTSSGRGTQLHTNCTPCDLSVA